MITTNFVACSGAGAASEMYFNYMFGYYGAAFAGALVVALVAVHWRKGGFVWLPAYAILLIGHPAWRLDVVSGDCGLARAFWTGAVAVLLSALLVYQLTRAKISLRVFLFAASAGVWLFYGYLLAYALWDLAPFVRRESSVDGFHHFSPLVLSDRSLGRCGCDSRDHCSFRLTLAAATPRKRLTKQCS